MKEGKTESFLRGVHNPGTSTIRAEHHFGRCPDASNVDANPTTGPLQNPIASDYRPRERKDLSPADSGQLGRTSSCRRQRQPRQETPFGPPHPRSRYPEAR